MVNTWKTARLDDDGKIPIRFLPDAVTDPGTSLPAGGTTDQLLAKTSAVDGAVAWKTVTKTDVGLGNVDDTADSAKPISTATQTALNAKVGGDGTVTTVVRMTNAAYTALATKDANTLYVIVG